MLFQFSFSNCDKHHDQREVKGNLLRFPFISPLLSIIGASQGKNSDSRRGRDHIGELLSGFSATCLLQPRSMCPRVAIPKVAWVLYINYQLRKLVYTGKLKVPFHRCNSSTVVSLPKHVILRPKLAITNSQSSNLIYKEKDVVAKFLLNE